MSDQVIEALQDAREKISKPEHWTQNAFARDAKGRAVSKPTEDACSFCAVGACYAVRVPIMARSMVGALEQTVRHHRIALHVASFNDREDTTHDDVLELFDETIQRLKGRCVEPNITEEL